MVLRVAISSVTTYVPDGISNELDPYGIPRIIQRVVIDLCEHDPCHAEGVKIRRLATELEKGRLQH